MTPRSRTVFLAVRTVLYVLATVAFAVGLLDGEQLSELVSPAIVDAVTGAAVTSAALAGGVQLRASTKPKDP